MTTHGVQVSNESIPLVSFWPLMSGPLSGMGAYFRGLQGDGRCVTFTELRYRARRGLRMPEALGELERRVLAPLRNGRLLEDIAGRTWVLGGQQFVSHFSPQRLETAIVVVFDMIDILCPDTHQTPAGVRAAWESMKNIRAAQMVVTISEYSRRRILDLYPMDADRVCVIPFGIDSDRFHPSSEEQKASSRRAFGLSDSSFVVLFVGSEQRRKNLGTLIAGLAECRKRNPDLVFVKAGAAQSDVGRRRFRSALKENQMEQTTILLDDLSDDQIVQLYRAADVVAFPSVEEGWGIPVLEAMASGTPVISSRIGPVVEFAGDSVLYVDDPYSAGDWSSGLRNLAADASMRERLKLSGRQRALGLTWDRPRELFAAKFNLVGVDWGKRACAESSAL